jgi:hypothetical protein
MAASFVRLMFGGDAMLGRHVRVIEPDAVTAHA